MNKFLLPVFFFALSFFLSDTQASSQPFGCKFHNSRNCMKPKVFEEQLEMGCASPSGNCRYQFCKSNCIDIQDAEKAMRHLCKENCLDPALLGRFNSSTREILYSNFTPSRKSSKYAKSVLEKEAAVQEAKSQQWWRFGRKPKNTALYEKLKAEYERLIKEKSKKVKAARRSGDTRRASKLQAELAQDIAEASENLVPPQQLPPVVAKAQEDAQDPQLTARKRELAAKVIQKWWRSKKGQKEAKRIEKERAEVARTLVADTGAPTEVLAETKRMSGEWREGPEGRYFIPKAPPLPQSIQVKRLSMELRRQSAAFADLPPPPPELLSDDAPTPDETKARFSSANVMPPAEEVGFIPPAPPPPPAGWTPKGKSTVPPPPAMPQDKGSSSATMSKGRGALLADLQSENPLSKLKKTSPNQGKRASSSTSGNSMIDSMMHSTLLERYKAIHGTEDGEEEEDDDFKD